MASDTVIILSLPRCGTHYIWSRLIHSDRYQMIYDASRIPAFQILSQNNDTVLEFLFPCPVNPNYNFQYNSLDKVTKPMSAGDHLAFLHNKYSTTDNQLLFNKIMSLQKIEKEHLFAVNLFCYTASYGKELGIEWSIKEALAALDLYWNWQMEYDPNSQFVFICRDIKEWVASFMNYNTNNTKALLKSRLEEFPKILEWCNLHSVKIFMLSDVIKTIDSGNIDFHKNTQAITHESQTKLLVDAEQYLKNIESITISTDKLRLKRTFEYLKEKDPILRTSLVRSLGKIPLFILQRLPFFRTKIKRDFEGNCLNNAALKI